MAIAEPTNCWTIAEQRLIDAVAQSAAFQAWVGVDNAAAAADRIFGEELPAPKDGENYRPDELLSDFRRYAMLHSSGASPYGKARGDSRRLEPFGNAELYLEQRSTQLEQDGYQHNPRAEERDWKNLVGGIMDQVEAWLHQNEGPFVSEWLVDQYGTAAQENSDRPLRGCYIAIAWGYGQQ